jgi:predicted HicB family RNase H-like nuclease
MADSKESVGRKQVLLRLEADLYEKVKVRAEEKGLSMNEWLNRAIDYAIVRAAPSMTVTETKKVDL